MLSKQGVAALLEVKGNSIAQQNVNINEQVIDLIKEFVSDAG